MVTQGWFHRNHPTGQKKHPPFTGQQVTGECICLVPRLLESPKIGVAMLGGSQWYTIISHWWCGSPCEKRLAVSKPSRWVGVTWWHRGLFFLKPTMEFMQWWGLEELNMTFRWTDSGSVSGKLEYCQHPSYSVDYTCFHPKRLISEWISRLKTLQKGSFRISPILQ